MLIIDTACQEIAAKGLAIINFSKQDYLRVVLHRMKQPLHSVPHPLQAKFNARRL